jgi:iron complex transport system substrate-binding protein
MGERACARAWHSVLRAGLVAVVAAVPVGAFASGLVPVDDRGVAVTLAAPPQRVVSLLPSITETVCALGACDRLVAVDTHSNWPQSVRALPQVGGLDDAQIESILAARPDLVLAAASTRAIARLESLGLKVMALEPRTLEDFRRVVGLLDQVLGTARGPRLLQQVDHELDLVARALPAAQRGVRVYFEVSSAPYAASESSFIGQLLARAGAANVVSGSLGPFPKLNPEFVVRADPQVIMITDRASGELSRRPGWAGLRALREGRVCRFNAAQADVLVRPGPRMAEGARLMVDCIQGRVKAAGL